MPGVGGTQFAFKDETPRTFKLVMLLLFTNLVGSFGVDLWVKHLAPRLPNASGPFPIQIKPGVVAFVPSWLGQYERSSLWVTLGILGLLALIFCWYGLRGQVIRVR